MDKAIHRHRMLVCQNRMLDPIPSFPSAKWYGDELRIYHDLLGGYIRGAVKLIRLIGSTEVAEGKSWHNPKGNNLGPLWDNPSWIRNESEVVFPCLPSVG